MRRGIQFRNPFGPAMAPVVIPDIVHLTYREDKGATGGPGGVLHVAKKLLGYQNEDLKFAYHFKDAAVPITVPSIVARFVKKLGFWPDFMEAVRFGWQLGMHYRHSAFIAHDIGTACGLSLARKKYVLVYHQQGAVASEKLGQGKKLNTREVRALNLAETIAFRRAQAVYFPSNGAYREFLSSTQTLTSDDFHYGGPLYNTVLPVLDADLQEEPDWISNLPKNAPVFLSVGALTWEKGVDQATEFMRVFGQLSKMPATWIIVGKGPFWDKINTRCQQLSENITPIMIKGPIPHSTVSTLMRKADLFIMGHRRSIFDFTTLEAMQAGCGLVLTPVGGNLEFNLRNNVVWLHPSAPEESAKKLIQTDWHLLGQRNQKLFHNQFSPEVFRENYLKVCHTLHKETQS